MTQFIVFQRSPVIEGPVASPPPDPEIVMAGLTESDSAQNAVHNLVAAGTFSNGDVSVIDATTMTTYTVTVTAKVSTQGS